MPADPLVTSNYFLVIEAGIFVRHSLLLLSLSTHTLSYQGTYYFNGPGTKSVAWGSFKRASTYSMGSIALGSFIVAILDLIRAGLQLLQRYEQGQGDAVGAAIACCAQCCMTCIASLVE
jgi:hypothetical protein